MLPFLRWAVRSSFYLTTAIDYPNGSPHLGHAYEKIIADAYARWYRLEGRSVFFLTGTDENGQKLAKAAADAGMETQAYVDKQVQGFHELIARLDISNDDFIRTTETRHIQATIAMWQRLKDVGDVYFDKYSGHYCLACEAFYVKSQAPDLNCPVHGTALQFVEEEGYFFRLSRHAAWVQQYIEEHKDFVVPHAARSEMLGRLSAEPLRDLSISRPNAGWGIPVPGHPEHVIYTWFDALINYYAAVTVGPKQNPSYWPCDLHIIGKDITWFHAVIWPAMLHAAGIEPPAQVYVHGMVLAADGKRMSKSLGNGVDPQEMVNKYGSESFRYYLLRAIASGQDGAFAEADLKTRYNNELANVYGNTLLRVAKFSAKKFGPVLDPPQDRLGALDMRKTLTRMREHMDAREHNRALDALWDGINEINAFLNANEPWRIKDNDQRVHQLAWEALHAMHGAAGLVQAFLPNTAIRSFALLGVPADLSPEQRLAPMSFRFGALEPLFPRLD